MLFVTMQVRAGEETKQEGTRAYVNGSLLDSVRSRVQLFAWEGRMRRHQGVDYVSGDGRVFFLITQGRLMR
jgi:hypothetical protein